VNPTSQLFGWAILGATFLGPVLAVFMTRYVDRQRDRHQRQLHVLRTLMATRRTVVSAEHVSALNLIEIEFHGYRQVIAAWKTYFQHLAAGVDPKDSERVTRERRTLLAKLLYEMAKVMKIHIEQLDILEGGYVPQAAMDVEQQNQLIRRLFTEIISGDRTFPVEVRRASGKSS
jgi:hypothetical protein